MKDGILSSFIFLLQNYAKNQILVRNKFVVTTYCRGFSPELSIIKGNKV